MDTDECIECKNAFCGDNMIRDESDEECDDGNQINGDGCSPDCLL